MTSATDANSSFSRTRRARRIGLAVLILVAGVALVTSMGMSRPPERLDSPRQDAFLFDQESPAYAVYGATGGTWLTGSEWDAQTVARVARQADATGRLPVLVLYAVPGRDKDGPSRGGLRTAAEYRRFVEKQAKTLGKTRALVIIEPDALPLGLAPERLREAVSLFRTHAPQAELYLDAGHSNWHPPAEMAKRLIAAGILDAAGFSLNVSAFEWTQANLDWGTRTVRALAALDSGLAEKRFVIDTSRNGNGPGVDEKGRPTWGDPVRAASGGPITTGPMPTFETGHPHCDAYVWAKTPGYGDNRTRDAMTFGGESWVKPQR